MCETIPSAMNVPVLVWMSTTSISPTGSIETIVRSPWGMLLPSHQRVPMNRSGLDRPMSRNITLMLLMFTACTASRPYFVFLGPSSLTM